MTTYRRAICFVISLSFVSAALWAQVIIRPASGGSSAATTSCAGFAAAMGTDVTGTCGKVVLSTSPTLVTPVLGVASFTSLTGSGATVVASTPLLNLSQTWNNAGAAGFSLIDADVTNTASPANTSYYFNFKTGGVQKLYARIGTSAGAQIGFDYWNAVGSSQFVYSSGGSLLAYTGSTASWNSTLGYGISASGSTSTDVFLLRDAVNTLAQRNATSAQKSRLYNTFTTVDTAGEWFKQDWITTANQFRFGAAKGSSTGTARVASWDYGGTEASPVAAISVPITSGDITFGGSVFPTGYKSSDGTAGLTATCTILSITTFTVKNGLITACS